MRKFRYAVYTATALTGGVFLTGGVMYLMAGTALILLHLPIEGFKGWIRGLGFLFIGVKLLNFGYNGMESEIRRASQQLLKNIPKPCRGCQNYHGVEYGGVMLVCAVHPEGVKGDHCPDHQKTIAPKN
ncbi:hypothetical protein [Anabaena azotica]|uniref:Uncharacterized protein n=1 Tax=Anabaena azotica FACHB-119 TaxID=947527 RepID=A0ABR8DE94_9NOST|nr:hypothetical protein [Anabaena azotica]MBD2505323.1 hypothetical protein [Anabaena azotica FACHB-119]